VETIGNWYWITDEIEAAGMGPRLVNARRAKLMSGSINKTDKLDARGINRLQRSGTLPTVWIPPRDLRDARELPRTRMMFVRQRTKLKNRIHANLAKYGLKTDGASDLFGVRGRRILKEGVNRGTHTTFPIQQAPESGMCPPNYPNPDDRSVGEQQSDHRNRFQLPVALRLSVPSVRGDPLG